MADNPNLMGLGVNYAASNKWVAHFALEDILGPNFKDIDLHLVRFSLPQMEMGSMEYAYRGYKKTVPTKVMNAETKELTLEYIVDEKWTNYKALFKWMSGIHGTLNPTADTSDIEKIVPSDYLPLRIYLIDNFKQKKIQFLFENCWIKLFNDLALEVSNSGQITHSFTMVYDRYTIEDV